MRVYACEIRLHLATEVVHRLLDSFIRLAVLNGNYGDVFDLSQVLLDLETLTMTADPKLNRTGFSSPFYADRIPLFGLGTSR